MIYFLLHLNDTLNSKVSKKTPDEWLTDWATDYKWASTSFRFASINHKPNQTNPTTHIEIVVVENQTFTLLIFSFTEYDTELFRLFELIKIIHDYNLLQ